MNRALRVDGGTIFIEPLAFYNQTQGRQVPKGKVMISVQLAAFQSRRNLVGPGRRMMERLAKKFLKCEYIELNRADWGLDFTIDSGLSLEDRSAFFAAIAAHTKIE